MYRILLVLCVLLSACDSSETIEPQEIPPFAPADVTYRIDGDLEDISVYFLQGDTAVHRQNMPALDSVSLPFEYSFRAETQQLLLIQLGALDCSGSLNCNATMTILLDGQIHKEMHLPNLFTEKNGYILSSVFTLSAWNTEPKRTVTYQVLHPYEQRCVFAIQRPEQDGKRLTSLI